MLYRKGKTRFERTVARLLVALLIACAGLIGPGTLHAAMTVSMNVETQHHSALALAHHDGCHEIAAATTEQANASDHHRDQQPSPLSRLQDCCTFTCAPLVGSMSDAAPMIFAALSCVHLTGAANVPKPLQPEGPFRPPRT